MGETKTFFRSLLRKLSDKKIIVEKSDVKMVYDTLLSAPGMEETVKLDLRISRKLVLLLSQTLQRGLNAKDEKPDMLSAVGPQAKGELLELTQSCLEKAGLSQLYQKLNAISG